MTQTDNNNDTSFEHDATTIDQQWLDEKAVDLPPIDELQLKTMEDNLGPDDFCQLLREFEPFSHELVENIQEAARNTETENLRVAAHNMKSTTASFGFKKLAVLCHDIEHACGKDKPDEAIKLVKKLPALHKESMEKLKELRPGIFASDDETE